MDRKDETDDRALAEALIAGKPEAFEPFVERFGPLIMNFGRRMCGQRDDAEEVLQETLLQAYISLKDLREPAALRTWVYRVAANACLRMRRRGRHDPEQEISLSEVLPEPTADGSPPRIGDWSEIPLDSVLRGELREQLDRAILERSEERRVGKECRL